MNIPFDSYQFEKVVRGREGFDALRELNDVDPSNWKEGYRLIKKFYILNEPEILKHQKRNFFKVYATPIWKFMNEVEQHFYVQCMSIGGPALYPLYFAHGYYLDFAIPYLKIGIEIDGKAFHDAEKDAKRDGDLTEFGWSIIRISASDVLKEQKWLSDIESNFDIMDNRERNLAIERFFSDGCIGLIYALRFNFFDSMNQEHQYRKPSQEALLKRTTDPINLYEQLYGQKIHRHGNLG